MVFFIIIDFYWIRITNNDHQPQLPFGYFCPFQAFLLQSEFIPPFIFFKPIFQISTLLLVTFILLILFIYKALFDCPSMRRFGIPNTENKYHQMTNLAIDLEAELRRSVILPKITQRYQEMQAWEYISRKKMEESNMVSRLQGEVDRLKRQMDRLEDKKYMWQKLKTEENMDEPSCPCFRERSLQKKVTGSCHLNPNDLRNSEDDGNERVQRNTEKQSTRAKLNASRSSISNLSTHDKQNIASISAIQQKASNKLMSESASRPIIDKEKIPCKKKRNVNKALRLKFRKCVFAVYFCILLPSLARRIYKNKLKLFIGLYPHEISKYYLSKKDPSTSKFKEDQLSLWSQMQQKMNFMQAIDQAQLASVLKDASKVRQVKVHFQFLINQELESQEREERNILSPVQQLMNSSTVEHLLGHLVGIAGQMADNFVQIVSEGFFSQNWQTFGQNILQGSFINNSRPKLLSRVIESGVVKMHPSKQSQISLLTFDIFCRIYCFRWMNKLHKDKLSKKYSEQTTLVANFLLSVLYLVGQTLIDDTVKTTVQTNRSLPFISKYLHRKVRPIIPLSVKRKYKGLNIDTKRLIIDAPLIDQASSVILDHPEIVSKIKSKMRNAGTELYHYLCARSKEQNRSMKSTSISEKYLISGDKQRPESLFSYQLTQPTSPTAQIDSFRSHPSQKEAPNSTKSQSINKSTISIMIKRQKVKAE